MTKDFIKESKFCFLAAIATDNRQIWPNVYRFWTESKLRTETYSKLRFFNLREACLEIVKLFLSSKVLFKSAEVKNKSPHV